MKLVLDITTEIQKQHIIHIAHQLNIAVEILETTKAEDEAALVRAIYVNAQGDVLSSKETAEFLAHLAK